MSRYVLVTLIILGIPIPASAEPGFAASKPAGPAMTTSSNCGNIHCTRSRFPTPFKPPICN